jgi:2-succinyl-5-enolpyruvyl-6-hydroxy-3-cyclohexene-1-carboxylate synthase
VDERSAAYFAVGLSLELNEPVGMTCTSAQATRNYLPGMTEAYYRKTPILAITTDYDEVFTNQLNMQSLRQMSIPSDTNNVSVDVPVTKDKNDENLAIRNINFALDSLSRFGGGPAHINLRINQHWLKGDDELEVYRKITRYLPLTDNWPEIKNKTVLVVIGQHHPFSKREKKAIEDFANKYNVVIYVNHISNYNGAKSVHGNLRLSVGSFEQLCPDLLITIGGHLGDYPLDGKLKNNQLEHWRVCADGEYADTYNKVTRIFECPEYYFFERMTKSENSIYGNSYYNIWKNELESVKLPKDFELSHALVAQKLSKLLPADSNIHFAILNSLRFWEFFTLDSTIRCYSNVAGFGIDGCLSTFLGQSVASNKLNFLIVGDLSFFYDMNSIGIRHLKNNIRIVLINNHGGGEFRLKTHVADSFGDASNRYIAASGHFGNSAKGWVENNGFDYIAVKKKNALDNAINDLIKPSKKPILIEIFTTMENDSNELQRIIDHNFSGTFRKS